MSPPTPLCQSSSNPVDDDDHDDEQEEVLEGGRRWEVKNVTWFVSFFSGASWFALIRFRKIHT